MSLLDSVQRIPILLATFKSSQSGASRACAFFSLSGLTRVSTVTMVNVVDLSHSLFGRVLVGLDMYNEHKCTVVFQPLHGLLGSQGELGGGIAVTCFSWRCPSEGVFGLPCGHSILGIREAGNVCILYFVAMDAFRHCFLCLRRLRFRFGFWEGQGFPSVLSAPSSGSATLLFKVS